MNNNIIIKYINNKKVYLARRDKQACLYEFIFLNKLKSLATLLKLMNMLKQKIHIHLLITELELI